MLDKNEFIRKTPMIKINYKYKGKENICKIRVF